MMRTRTGRAGLLAGGALAALLLGACDPGQTSGQGATVPTFSSSPSEVSSSTDSVDPSSTDSSESAEPTASTAAPASTKAADPGASSTDCKAADLKLSLSGSGAGAGHYYEALRFYNKGSRTCTIQGFPGVSYVTGSDGHQVGAAAYREGTKGAVVTLHPGSTAYAEIDAVNVHNYDPADCKPTATRGLRIYPPHDTAAMFVAQSGTGCAKAISGNQLTVKTVKPGTG